MLVDERGAVVDLVVHDEVEVLLGVVLGNLLEGEFLLVRHDGLGYYRSGKRKQTC